MDRDGFAKFLMDLVPPLGTPYRVARLRGMKPPSAVAGGGARRGFLRQCLGRYLPPIPSVDAPHIEVSIGLCHNVGNCVNLRTPFS
jgi:hypothetical protein